MSKLQGRNRQRQRRQAQRRRIAAGAGLALGATLAAPAVSQAATDYTVTNTSDTGAGSLRDALAQANSNPGADRILFQSGLSGTISLTSGLTISDAVQIDGPGAGDLSIDGSGDGGKTIFDVNLSTAGDPVSISGLELTGGGQPASAGYISGGAIHNRNSALTVASMVFSKNKAGGGGGIFSDDEVTVDGSTFTGNSANYGGGIEVDRGSATVSGSTFSGNTGGDSGSAGIEVDRSALAVADSTFDGNSASYGGGIGIFNGSSLTISGSTLSGNTSDSLGGGLYMEAPPNGKTDSISNTTITGNSAADHGGGIATYSYSATPSTRTLTLDSVTVAGNTAGTGGGGIWNGESGGGTGGDDGSLSNTIVATNSSRSGGADLDVKSGKFYTQFSLIQDAPVASFTDTVSGSDVLGKDPQLGPLADNGGPTPTRALTASSPAVNQGSTALTADQRGSTRPVEYPGVTNSSAAGANGADIGAYELQVPPPPPPATPPPAIAAAPRVNCVVPKLRNKTLAQAKKLLASHHCRLAKAKVTAAARRRGKLRVTRSSPAAGTVLPANAKVSVRLGSKARRAASRRRAPRFTG